jgi:phosphopantothenoylcysteine decarboxylase/phosphopantothenate--cysteine ligase
VGPARDADLAGRHLVVTAGGTREAIDPVRFIGNRSTGRMGAAIAEAALDRGARVTVIAANVEVDMPPAATLVRVGSTADLRAALLGLTHAPAGAAGFDVLVMAAAVSDFRPVAAADAKLPRSDDLTLRLEATPDLLAEVARIAHGVDSDGAATREPLRPVPLLVGFAAETGSLERAADKLVRKGVDLLVANDVAEPGSGFGTETNRVSILAADGSRADLPLQSKRAVADALLDRVAAALDERDAAGQTGSTTEHLREPA